MVIQWSKVVRMLEPGLNPLTATVHVSAGRRRDCLDLVWLMLNLHSGSFRTRDFAFSLTSLTDRACPLLLLDLPLSSPTSKLRCYPCHRGPTSASEMAIPRRCFRHRAEGISIPGSRYVVLASDCFWAVTQTNTLRIDNHISN